MNVLEKLVEASTQADFDNIKKTILSIFATYV